MLKCFKNRYSNPPTRYVFLLLSNSYKKSDNFWGSNVWLYLEKKKKASAYKASLFLKLRKTVCPKGLWPKRAYI